MKALTNPSPEAMLSIDNEILMDNLNQLFNKFILLKTEAYSPSAVMRLADEMRENLENALRCLTSRRTIENKIHLYEVETKEKIAKIWQEAAEHATEILEKCVAKNCN
ncbi:hypothetical protein G6719_06660 [Polynucleobacter paneuropaeus]|nr:hypothetical protein G6719_06660 [Polynucleobacter paneuropaeus]